MNIIIGGERRKIQGGTTVAQLLVLENVEMPEYVSVSVNEQFVQKEAFSTTVLHDGDVVEFLYYMGGGQ
ncbi:MAG: sulfur carrier protein ThiS [Clostridia bacterium]|nr:sulfur carrier protein ThiS [Clostridia bacterium]